MSAYLSAVLADAPVHYWRCADPGGQVLFDIGSTPIEIGGGPFGMLPYSGPVSDGGSCNLSGVGSFCSSGKNIHFPAGSFSLELWVFVWQHIDTGEIALDWSDTVAMGRSGTQWDFRNNTSASDVLSNANYTDRVWHHLVGTYDGTTSKLYVDGTLRNSAAHTSAAAFDAQVLLSKNAAGTGNGFDSFFSEVAIYNTAISAARVTAHFSAADNTAQMPVWTGSSKFNSSSGGPSAPGADLSQVLNAVQKTYQNSP